MLRWRAKLEKVLQTCTRAVIAGTFVDISWTTHCKPLAHPFSPLDVRTISRASQGKFTQIILPKSSSQYLGREPQPHKVCHSHKQLETKPQRSHVS